MRHDVSAANYVTEGAKWDAVAHLIVTDGGSTFDATGTLVPSTVAGEFKILTAAHNVDTPAGGALASSVAIHFGDNTSSDGSTADFSFSTTNISVQSKWQNGDGSLTSGSPQYDFAVLTFTAADITKGAVGAFTSAISPMFMSTANPIGQVGTMVGYGISGTGQEPFENNPVDGIRRAGTNTLDAVNSTTNPPNTGFTIRSDFDSPAANRSSLGSSSPIPLEASTGSGDSGGPLIVDFGSGPRIVGVLNGGFNAFSTDPSGVETDPSEYGDVSIWAWAGDTMNMDYLTSAGISLTAIPEPSALWCMGLLGLTFVVRSRIKLGT